MGRWLRDLMFAPSMHHVVAIYNALIEVEGRGDRKSRTGQKEMESKREDKKVKSKEEE